MKRIFTTLLLVITLSGVHVVAEASDSALRTETTTVSATSNSLHPSSLQRRRRRRMRRRMRRRWRMVHRNNGRRVGRRWVIRGRNTRRWNNGRRVGRRWNNRRGGGHGTH